MIKKGETYNGRLVIKNSGAWVTYQEGNTERECTTNTFIARHGETPDKEVTPCKNATPATSE